MPSLSQIVDIVGYPQGGDSICITRGIVSRVNESTYTHSKGNTELPTLQVDAAINPGNSGGPVSLGLKVVGVAFQRLHDGDNIGYVIPAPFLNIFLRSIESGQEIVGFCSLGLGIQAMDNQMMRSYFEMTRMITGVLVTHIDADSWSREMLRKNDILLEVDGNPRRWVSVGTIGMHINGFIALKNMNDKVSLKVLRKGLVKNFHFAVLPVLEGDINNRYTSFGNLDVHRVNGRRVSTVEDMCRIIAKAIDFVRLDLENDFVAVIDLKLLRQSDGRLLKFHKIMHGISKNLEDAYPCLGEKLSD